MADTQALDRSGSGAVARVDDLWFATESGVELRADLYLPRPIDAAPLPVIVWLHGGTWRFGDRRLAPDLSRFFAAQGFAMASIEYRLSTQALFPAPVRDVKTAVRWLRSVAPDYGLDVHRIGLVVRRPSRGLGGPVWTRRVRGGLVAVRGVLERRGASVDGYGPTDFLQTDAHRAPDGTRSDDPESLLLPDGLLSALPESPESQLLGAPIESCPERVRDATPIAYARERAPAALILHGANDTTVPVHQSVLLYEALAVHDNQVSLTIVDGLGHGFLNRSHLDDGLPRALSTRTDVPGHGGRVVQASGHVFATVEAFFRESCSARARPAWGREDRHEAARRAHRPSSATETFRGTEESRADRSARIARPRAAVRRRAAGKNPCGRSGAQRRATQK